MDFFCSLCSEKFLNKYNRDRHVRNNRCTVVVGRAKINKEKKKLIELKPKNIMDNVLKDISVCESIKNPKVCINLSDHNKYMSEEILEENKNETKHNNQKDSMMIEMMNQMMCKMEEMEKRMIELQNKPSTISNIVNNQTNNQINIAHFDVHINVNDMNPIQMLEKKLGSKKLSESYIISAVMGANKNNVLQWFKDVWLDSMKAPVRNLGNGELLISVSPETYKIVNKEQIHDLLNNIICQSYIEIINRPLLEISELATKKNKEKSVKWIHPKEEESIDNELDNKIGTDYFSNPNWIENPIDHLIKHNKLRATASHYKETMSAFPEATEEEKSILKILA